VIALLEQPVSAVGAQLRGSPTITEDESRAARRSLRVQIERLERELAAAFVASWASGGLDPHPAALGEPRLLGLGELERARDTLADRLSAARQLLGERAQRQEANRVYLEQMILEPGRHRFARVRQADIGEPGCGVWQARPRLGLLGMLVGWWQVKLSSGCPLPVGRAPSAALTAPHDRAGSATS
jgi:hypothetical protein